MIKQFTNYKNNGTMKQRGRSGFTDTAKKIEEKESYFKKNLNMLPGLSAYNKYYSADAKLPENKELKTLKSGITEILEQNRLTKASGKSIFRFAEDKEIEKFGTLKEKKPNDYYRKFSDLNDEISKQKELFGALTDFSITNFEKNFDKMNPDEQTMFTGKAQGFFNRKGYTDKNGKRLKEDGVWGPKTQMTYEKYKEDEGYPKADNVKTLESSTPKNAQPEITNVSNKKKDVFIDPNKSNNMLYKSGYLDKSVDMKKYTASKVIIDNKNNILNAAKKHGVNPGILAATIYSEQYNNVDAKDKYLDPVLAPTVDVSLGVGQVLISTARMLEDKGYMPVTKHTEWHGNNEIESRETGIAIKLQNPATNIEYAAAYLAYISDLWKDAYPEIGGRTAIMATLYNVGENGSKNQGPHANPQSNSFGDFAKDNYYYMRELLGLSAS